MIIEILKAILFGIVEGITEWLPVSSTGHLILLDEFVKLKVSAEFFEMFQVVIQLGAIFAVLVLFFHKLNPFSVKKGANEKKQTWDLWLKVVVAVLPSAVLGLLLDDWMDEHLYNFVVVAIALIVYGVAFMLVERQNKQRKSGIGNVHQIDYRTALLIGAFQCLSLIPGTSRSGSTILGGILLGVSRPAAAEFSFFLAIPTMLGASALKIVKYGYECLKGEALPPNITELVVLIVGCVVSFIVSMAVIRALMEYVRKRSFSAFGIYRIILGVVVIGYFLLKVALS
jgi:undecaprenyl-diphosphatase